MKVLDFGSLNYDNVYELDHIILPGETETSGALSLFLGGKGLNQAIALAKAGVTVYLAGQIGEDGDEFLEACRAAGVRTDYLKKVPGKSGHTVIQLDKNGQNSIILFGGANRSQTRENMDDVLSHFEKDDILLIQNEINELPYLIDRAYDRGMRIVLNPSPYDEGLDACDLEKVAVFLLNEVEGFQLTGSREEEAILEGVAKRFPDAVCVLTLGEKGAVYRKGHDRVVQAAFPVTPVDTTAAGDTFTGYFIAGYTEGMPVHEILRMASKAASVACTRMGAAGSIPLREEVERLLRTE